MFRLADGFALEDPRSRFALGVPRWMFRLRSFSRIETLRAPRWMFRLGSFSRIETIKKNPQNVSPRELLADWNYESPPLYVSPWELLVDWNLESPTLKDSPWEFLAQIFTSGPSHRMFRPARFSQIVPPRDFLVEYFFLGILCWIYRPRSSSLLAALI